MNEQKIIALWGETPGVGKDTVADILVHDHGFTKREFKTQLIYHTWASTPEIWRALTLSEWKLHCSHRELKDVAGTLPMSPRQYLIKTGRKIKEDFGEYYFADTLVEHLPDNELIVIPDLRFSVELEVLLYSSCVELMVVKVDRSVDLQTQDCIEKEYLQNATDFTINNNGTMEDLCQQVSRLSKLL